MTAYDNDVHDVARHFKLKPGHVYRMAEQGKIPSIKVGKYRRFSLDAVLAALEKDNGAAVR